MKEGLYWDALSRAYYAYYNALISLLLFFDLPLPKTHSGLIRSKNKACISSYKERKNYGKIKRNLKTF